MCAVMSSAMYWKGREAGHIKESINGVRSEGEIYLTPDDATEGQDYFPLPQETVKLYDWPNTTLVTVGIIDDKLIEGEERFNIHLRDVSYNHTVIGRPNLAEVIIEDNDEVCPNGWYYFRRSCYLFINESLSFEAAESACSDEEACLASSTSAGENHFIANTVTKGQRSWIGGSDLCRDDYWQWDNGDPWRYTNWRHGEPNNALPTTREHCLEINYVRPGLWNNHFCHRPKSAVCKCPLP
ncbi:putative type-2 ice-structuring protein-like [Apostichopus japonicus]|uniref:Putative type-2 ice-structuring protein-like n=1 Tax=Stichopus japonicus TaxID=307972 RepID=A0A2G8JVE9_STIJA|nr:putative type-2 ice-structuring protein-like [Apostichopus japonicus]